MKANEIIVGGKYVVKVSGKLTTVRVDEIREVDAWHGGTVRLGRGGNTKTVYDVTNLTTGRRTTFRSATKFRCVASDPSGAFEGRLKRLAERGAAGLITAEEQDKQHAAILTDEQQRRNEP
jgi:hypothetical protein